MNKLEHFVALADSVFKNTETKAKINQYLEIDKMLACDFELPDALKKVGWLQNRKFVSTAPADAVNSAVRAFADRGPVINVQPFSSYPEEFARVERIERALEWELENMGTKGKKPIHWQIVDSAMKYCKVALQTEYLPYVFKGREKDNYIKAVLKSSKFNWRLHHPATVFSQDGPYGVPEFVVSRTKRTANWLASKFGQENKGVKEMLSKMKGDLATQLDQELWYYDVMTWNERACWASFTNGGSDDTVTKGFEFMLDEHKLPFMPWVIVDNEDPILKSVIDANLWDTSNIIRTMVFAKTVDMVEQPQFWIQTMTGDLEDVSRAEGGVNEPIVTSKTTNIQQLRPPQIDPQLENIKNMAESEIYRSTAAEVLASVQNISSGTPFSTVNAMLQAALTQLALAKNAAERAETLALKQSLDWINFTDIPLEMYRTKGRTVGDNTYERGQEIILVKAMDVEDIPEGREETITPLTETVYMTVTLQPNAITDKQMEQTMAINEYERLKGSLDMIWEKYGLGDYSQHQVRRKMEDLTDAAVEAEAKRILQQPDLEAAAQQMQMQQEQQMQMQQEQMQQQEMMAAEGARLDQQSPAFSGMEGVDPRAGGMPTGQPGMGREQLTGQSVGGEDLA